MSRVGGDRRPRRLAPLANTPRTVSHPCRERDKVNAPIVLIGRYQRNPFLDPFHCGTPLAGLGVMNAYAELEEDTNEVGLVTDAFEEQLFEKVARFEVFAFIEKSDASLKPRIIDQFQVSDRN